MRLIARGAVALITAVGLFMTPIAPADHSPSFFLDATMLGYGVPEIDGLAFYDSSRGGATSYQDAHFIAYNRTLISVGNSGLCAAYAEKNMGAPVTRIGTDFKISSGAYGGSVALALWSRTWGGSDWASGVPDAPAHVVVNLNDWAFQIFQGNQSVGLAQGTFSPALPANMPLHIDVRLNRTSGVATLDLPNGQTATVTDSRIKLAANYAVFESWRMYAATQGQPQIISAWADTR